MGIRVLDPDGRPLRPMSRSTAASKVARGDARWLHAEGIAPDVHWGTIVLVRPVVAPPPNRDVVQVFGPAGEAVGWVPPAWAEHTVAARRAIPVGAGGEPQTLHAIIVPGLTTAECDALRAAIRREAW